MNTRLTVAALALLSGLGAYFVSGNMEAATPTERVAAEVENFAIDAGHSAVIWRSHHLGAGYTYGRFNQFGGEFSYDSENPGKSSIQFTIDAGSIDSNDEGRDRHLKSPDFLNAKQFPKINFKSTKIEKAGEDSYKITGDLTLKGTTKPVTAEMEFTGRLDKHARFGTRVGFEGTMVINRMDFGVNYMPGGLGESIKILISIEGVKK